MNNIKIRNVEKQDIPQVVEININDWKTAYRGIIDDEYLDNVNIEEKIKRREQDYKEHGFIVAELDGEIVGFCRYVDNIDKSPETPEADCELMAIYVNSELKNFVEVLVNNGLVDDYAELYTLTAIGSKAVNNLKNIKFN